MALHETLRRSDMAYQNGKRATGEVAAAKEVTYRYLDESWDVTSAQKATTIKSYDSAANLYQEQNGGLEIIKVMWEKVFKDYKETIIQLPERAKIFLPGIGTSRDAFFPTLLRPGIKVVGSDLSPGMLAVGQSKIEQLTWTDIKEIGDFIRELDPMGGRWMINRLIDSLQDNADILSYEKGSEGSASERIDIQKLFKMEEVVKSLVKRIFLLQEDLRHLSYADNTFDMVMAIAVYPHLSKRDVLPAVLESLRVLKPGQIFYFDLRADLANWYSKPKGRTFEDNVLNGGSRFFSTYTLSEVLELITELKRIIPPIEVTFDNHFSPHFDTHKPPFLQFQIRKAKEVTRPSLKNAP